MSRRSRMKGIGTVRASVASAFIRVVAIVAALVGAARAEDKATEDSVAKAQVPDWSADDLRFFLHGSMSTEVMPEVVLKAFRATYPGLFPGRDMTAFGAIADGADDLPIGFSRGEVSHLGGLRCVGINCAACHVTDVVSAKGGEPVRVLGATSLFDVEILFGAVAAATFQTADPANMKRFLGNYWAACDSQPSRGTKEAVETELHRQGDAIAAAIATQLAEEQAVPPGRLYDLDPATLALNASYFERTHDLTPAVKSLLRLFHNMRAALHIPQQPPDSAPPRSGPGRNNAFGILSAALFGEPTIYGPAKFGLVWNLERRDWVHWDGNTRSPIIRNLSASLGLGAPLNGKHGDVDFSLVERHTRLSERIHAPRYPWKIDSAKAQRGRAHFDAHCASCHAHSPDQRDDKLFGVDEVKTDPNRATLFTDHQAELYNKFFAELEVDGFHAPEVPPVRSTRKYVAVDLAGVWARSPYLHNGSVRTMAELLTTADLRSKTFHRGSRVYDEANMGYVDDGDFQLDTSTEGNKNVGHEYGTTDLNDDQKRELIEYLKTL